MNEWLTVNASGNIGEIYIYGEIVDYKWTDEDASPSHIKTELDKLKNVDSINLYVNSPGGNVFAGVAIYNLLKRAPQKVTAYIDGIAASIASLIILAADKVVMPLNGIIMIHNPWMVAAGEASTFRDLADRLDKITDSVLISTYQEKTGIDKEKLKAMMDNETWLGADEAKELGFIDEIQEELKIAASYSGDNIKFKDTEIILDKFKSFPKDKFTEHKPTNNTLKQSHRHRINMLLADN